MRRAIFTAATTLIVALLALPATAQFKPIKPEQTPPWDTRENYMAWMKANRGESDKWLNERWNRFVAVVRAGDIKTDKVRRAFLLTPREVFAAGNPPVAARGYEHAFLDMGYGVTMSGPHLQSRMTDVLDVKRGEKVLEIGTGSGTQAGYLSELTDKVYTIEIIAPLATRTRGVYDRAIAAGYEEFKVIQTKQADGYYGWQEAGPFDKIIVTCGIDHVPPPLLQQLKPGGIMVIPVGPPGAQRVLKVVKQVASDGAISVTREDIYGGKIVPFVPFTKLVDGQVRGTHNR
ncbi:MAG TPA: protein-L-isoaspartate O-methyltransferase [Vineibacter sp.]|nr:protein-L-isoaspartate O-methyltransferase [Vineibacter sp.]